MQSAMTRQAFSSVPSKRMPAWNDPRERFRRGAARERPHRAHLGRAWTPRPPQSAKAAKQDSGCSTHRTSNPGGNHHEGGMVVELIGRDRGSDRAQPEQVNLRLPLRTFRGTSQHCPRQGDQLAAGSPAARWPRGRRSSTRGSPLRLLTTETTMEDRRKAAR